jgi:hypothetical protein
MRVVRRDREGASPSLESLVPLRRRVSPPDFEIAAGVVDLESEQSLAFLPVADAEPAPVRVGEVRGSSLAGDPAHGFGERPGLRSWPGIRRDPEGEHVGDPSPVTDPRVELCSMDRENAVAGRLDRADVMIGDGERVEAGPLVMGDEEAGRELAVRVGCVRVEGAAKPDPVGAEGILHQSTT